MHAKAAGPLCWSFRSVEATGCFASLTETTVNSRERVFHLLAGQPIDCLPAMPITMMFAADQLGRKYLDYSLDSRVLAEAQIQTATAFDFDHVSCIAETKLPADEPASRRNLVFGAMSALDVARHSICLAATNRKLNAKAES